MFPRNSTMKAVEPDDACRSRARNRQCSASSRADRRFCGKALELLVGRGKKRANDVLPAHSAKRTAAGYKHAGPNIIAPRNGSNIKKHQRAGILKKSGELAGLLTSLEKGDVLFN